jgi:uncharacterized protein (DUF362 family)/Pyruvate/2-oxoacid:ferredoxin oxidoreductase delta subunit
MMRFSRAPKKSVKSKVALVRCPDYGRETLTKAVRSSLGLIGGLSSIIKKGDGVLIKPNLLSAKRPEQAITTHPELVAAVAEEVKKLGGRPMIGDSPGVIRQDLREVWSTTGMQEVSERTGAPLVSFEAGGSQKKMRRGQTYYISRVALEADVIFNLPKLKTHSLVLFTGAVKNMFGVIPGFHKKGAHLSNPRPMPFSAALVDIFSFVPPQITLMDAVEGMEGDGPSAGVKRQVGLLLAGRDAVAVDAVAAMAVGIDPLDIHTCQIAAQQGLGVCSGNQIQVVGERLEELMIKKFVVPRTSLTGRVPQPLARLVRRFVYIHPQILPEICTNCDVCVRSCPTGALNSGSLHPQFRPRKCIGCLCCHELCPESAIKLRWSLMARLSP